MGLMAEREDSDDERGRDKVGAEEMMAWVKFDQGTFGWVGFINCCFVLIRSLNSGF